MLILYCEHHCARSVPLGLARTTL